MSALSNQRKKKRGRPRNSSKWSPEQNLRLLTEVESLNDDELGAFLRREGLHENDLVEIREAALVGLDLRNTRRARAPKRRK